MDQHDDHALLTAMCRAMLNNEKAWPYVSESLRSKLMQEAERVLAAVRKYEAEH